MRVRGKIRRPLATVGAALAVWLIVGQIHLSRLLRRVRPGKGRVADAGIAERIRRELLSWPGVTVAPHRYGGIEFRLGKRELGHLHGDYLADLPFPIRLREELVATRRAMPHHILPLSGWVSYPIRDVAAIPGVLSLFRLAYDRATVKRDVSTMNAEDAERRERRDKKTRRDREKIGLCDGHKRPTRRTFLLFLVLCSLYRLCVLCVLCVKTVSVTALQPAPA